MAIFAYGPKQIRSLESTLAAKLPKNAANRPRAELTRYIKERFARRKARRLEVNRLLTQARAPIVELLKKDKRYAACAEAFGKLSTDQFRKMRAKRPRTKPKFEPRLIANSGLTVRVPPYDFPGMWSSGGTSAIASADEKTGRFGLSLSPDNDSAAAWAGVAANFFSTEDNLKQRLAVLVDYDYAWIDSSTFFGTAHNDGSTNVWIWGFTENGLVGEGYFDPKWSDGTSGFEEHGSGGDGSDQSGRESLEVVFTSRANSVYQVLVWSSGSCDDDLFSFALQVANKSVPLMVLGG
jgi:hypothetical protein